MIIIQSSQTNKVQASPTTSIWEFTMEEKSISGAIAAIKDRYPEKGFAVNRVSKELVFVISGNGHIITPNQKKPIQVGDLVFLDKRETYAWEGNLTLFMANTPKFDPKQHKISDE
ncbi:hypothetical protein A2973_04545 [Candidatus Gottesmanbacteria bacterium RIFCSPLOWO2_01_FULL_49_10]|uniref:(S)-ureidoglycine aminohydrolase cupin domain-containing protein n=1 Tax=Candidatus Gottesmanbacteria bacterium RIFCSPLOWO2_01_FULL_49_10 TaxID=1798396 RepID=A0A1F6AW23_9BACT|nr:MAG: hypothetical protein UY10_C0009G0020 [Microgenomates group bacterium GW2011_GWA2_47_8]OGG28860.1 MAG: hypothetical protein A2973_04545 [Candidatus Gottesmanbacteria bacterium RIFCSPLOWO2_01_FULL_49_10]